MYESSNELLKLTQNSSVRTKTHARIHVQYTPRVEQFWAVVPQRQKGRPGMGGTGAIHTSEVDEGAGCVQRLQASAAESSYSDSAAGSWRSDSAGGQRFR